MKIVLGNLKDNGADLATFLEPRIGVKPTSSGGELTIEDDSVRKGVKPQQIKTYIKRYLLKSDQRKLYKIVVEGKELTLVYLEEMEEEEEEKKRQGKAKKAEAPKDREATESPATETPAEGPVEEEAPSSDSEKSG